MRRLFVFLLLLAVGAVGLAMAGRPADSAADTDTGGQTVGLFTSLPILWRETPDLSGLLQQDAPPHWALPVLQRHGRHPGALRPLDTLHGAGGPLPLDRDALLVMAQPRPLAPEENVALDGWVAGGGHVLLFADPMLTQESAFALGDKRRPQDVVLLSPILSRWGLALQFEAEQPVGERRVSLFGASYPVNLPGRFVLAAGTGHCRLLADGLAAQCRIGKGGVLAIADAALLEGPEAAGETAGDDTRAAILVRLLQEAQGPQNTD